MKDKRLNNFFIQILRIKIEYLNCLLRLVDVALKIITKI